jgi:hypothetical protein
MAVVLNNAGNVFMQTFFPDWLDYSGSVFNCEYEVNI